MTSKMVGTGREGGLSSEAKRLGYLRLDALVGDNGLFPISKSTWWNKVRSGDFPPPVKLGPRITAWRVADILELIERFERGEA
jgi:hypothetical protein